jgi:hypothetical protein
MFYRDQWPYMYTLMVRQDKTSTPIDPGDDLMAYSRTVYNGVNYMQVFAANSIMQRKLTPEAEILMMTRPF